MSKFNVVVVSNDTEYKVSFKNKLTDDRFTIVGYSEIEPSAKVRITGFVPDVVVFLVDNMDIDASFMDFIESMNLSSIGAFPVILTDKVSVDLVNMAAQSGVRQVMDLDVSGEEFTSSIIKIIEKERKYNVSTTSEKKTRSRVFGFFSGKGGVGKTTLCTNAAVALASRGKKTLLVDLDLQFGDADMALDIEPKETIVDLSRDPNGITLDSIISVCTTHPSGFQMLASPSSPELAEYVTSSAVKTILDIARNQFEYILIDCGCALVDPVITALENSDTIFMVNDVNILSLKRAKVCFNVIQQLNQKEKARLIINKNVKKNTVTIADYENLLGIPAYAVISDDFKSVNTSLNNGQPVVMFRPRSPIARDLSEMVDKMILEREGTLENSTANKGRKKKKS
ncbi:MAG: AAA family ATPase [Eubacterium sp.]|nr:AAA family ATPase [Eubacterium sp.]